jgi:hypothetical protein
MRKLFNLENLNSEKVLLGMAIAIALIFVGLLVRDLLRRRRRTRRRHFDHESGRPHHRGVFEQMRLLQREIKQMLRDRAQRKAGHRHRPPGLS